MTKEQKLEILNAFGMFLNEGLKKAIKLFPEYTDFLVTHQGKTIHEIELLLADQSFSLNDPAQKRGYPGVIRRDLAAKPTDRPSKAGHWNKKQSRQTI